MSSPPALPAFSEVNREAGVLLAGIQSLKTNLKMDDTEGAPTGALGNDNRGELVFQRYVNNYNANVLNGYA